MSKLVLYSQEISPPCRAVLMAAEAIGVNFDIREINLFNQDQLTEEFRKLNPQHTIPTLDDDGLIVWDSHAIMCYLVSKYAKDDSLYPKDFQKRARVDIMLHYDSGILFPSLKRICKPVVLLNETSIPEEKVKDIEEAYKFLEKFLDGKEWLAGDSYTLADISCIATISSLIVFRSLDDFPNTKAWMERCEEHLPGYKKCNIPGSKQLHEAVRQKLSTGS